jgi:hypothetical protein
MIVDNNNDSGQAVGVRLFFFGFLSLPLVSPCPSPLLSLSPGAGPSIGHPSAMHGQRQASPIACAVAREQLPKQLRTLAGQASVDHETGGKNMRATSVFPLQNTYSCV